MPGCSDVSAWSTLTSYVVPGPAYTSAIWPTKSLEPLFVGSLTPLWQGPPPMVKGALLTGLGPATDRVATCT